MGQFSMRIIFLVGHYCMRINTRRKEKCLIKFKSPWGLQQTLSLMGKVRNIFAIDVGRYTNAANIQRVNFQKAKSIWDEAMHVIAAA